MSVADDSSANVQRVEHLLNLMTVRMPWTMGAKVVEAVGIHKSRGWLETISSFGLQLLPVGYRPRVDSPDRASG